MNCQICGTPFDMEGFRCEHSIGEVGNALIHTMKELELTKGAMRADDERLRLAGERVGLYFGCDTAEHMADEIEKLRSELEAATKWRPTETFPTNERVLARFEMNGASFVCIHHYDEFDKQMGYINKDDGMGVQGSRCTGWLPLPSAEVK